MANPFEVLGVERSADEGQIRKAYRMLARRWHPDRFAEGPERMWAEQKMIEINTAYHAALQQCCGQGNEVNGLTPEREQLEDVKKLMELGQLSAARQALMRVATRNAEWNYLFGAVLLRLGEYEKAVLYFGVAARQRPANSQYRAAYRSAEAIRNQKKTHPIFQKLAMGFGGRR